MIEHSDARIKEISQAPALAAELALRPEVKALLDLIRSLKSFAKLQDIIVDTTTAWSKSELTDHEATLISELAHERRKDLRQTDALGNRMPTVVFKAIGQGRASHFAERRKTPTRDREASRHRRRILAASGLMPPQLAASFTQGELSVLAIVSDEVRIKGSCQKTLAELAARAGVCITTARKAYLSRGQARANIFDFIERFYNAKRRHSTIGYLSPIEFERRAEVS